MTMKVSLVIVAALFIAASAWPCHDYGFNGPIPNCLSCTVLGNYWSGSQSWYSVCTNCTAGFFLNQSSCLNCTANCISCTSNGACTSSGCAVGYTLAKSNGTCIPCPTGCAQCTYQTNGYSSGVGQGPLVCTACIYANTYINSAGVCTSCPDPNCAATGATVAYLSWNNGATSVSTVNLVQNYANSNKFPWSAYSGSICPSGSCSGSNCADGYYMSSSTCTACSSNCLRCSSGTVCTICANGYYISSGACTACPSNCLSCTSSGCSVCAPGYGLVGGTTCTACTVANCLSCATAAGQCDNGNWNATGTGCALGYTSLSATATTCTACPTNCTYCQVNSASTSSAVCMGAFTNYWTGASFSSGCNAGTVPQAVVASSVTVGYTCIPCPANCTTCSLTNINPSASAGSIGWCTACQANYTAYNGNCYACPNNCTSCASNGTSTVCLQCALGFGLSDLTGQCIPCPPNCDFCDGAGVCTQCRQGTWSTAAGAYLSTTAASNNPVPVNVTQGYWLPPNQCQQCPYNCSQCANSTFCLNNCTKGYNYTAATGQCLPLGAERIVLAGFALLSVLFYFI